MKATGRTPIKLQSSLCTDNPTGSDTYPFSEEPTQVVENTGIERNGGITNVYEQETTFATAGANSIITQDGSVLQVDASYNARLNDVAIGNVGPCSVYRRGLLAGYLDAAWTHDNTIIGIKRVGTVITVDEFDPATKMVTNTRNITFASMPTGLILNVSLVKSVDMSYVDAQEFIVSQNTHAYHLSETGMVVTELGINLNFVSRSSAAVRTWSSVCWSPELGLFCAVVNGGTGVVMTSPDGIIWTLQAPASAQQWTSVCWSPALGLFCAVAANGLVAVQVMTSPDGVNWTSRTSASARTWYSVCWSPALVLFCAVSEDGLAATQVMVSSDGTNWVSKTAANAQTWTSVCWSPDLNLFCAVAFDGAVAVQIMTSPDGTNWTARTSPSAQQWMSVCWSPALGIFCAVAMDGAVVGVQVMTSNGYIAKIDTAWKFAASKYLFGRQGIADSWYIGSLTALVFLALWKWAIFNRHTGTAYSRAILTRSPTQVSTSLIGYAEVGYSSAGVWLATPTGYGPSLAAATATISNPISAPGYAECTYVRSDTGTTIYYYCAPDFTHVASKNYAYGVTDTHTPINAYGKLTDLWNNINSAMVACLASLRVCMQPVSTTGGIATYLSVAPLSATTVLDTIGVPIINIGDFDDTFCPHVDDDNSTHSRIIYRSNGNLFYVDIESGVAHSIYKISETVYQVNTISAINTVDTIKKTLELGVNDYNGRMIHQLGSGTISATLVKIAATLKSDYANSIDVGDRFIANYLIYKSVSIPGIEIPTFIDRQLNYGVDVYIADTYENTYPSRYVYTINSDKTGTLYVPDTRVPIAMGYSYAPRTVQTEVSTILTGVGITGQPDIDYGYSGYEIGNDIGGLFQSFVLYGQRYLFDGFQIWIATFTGSLYSTKELVCPANGMTFVGVAPTEAYFLSAFDNSLYTFDGGRALKKAKRLNDIRNTSGGVEIITDGIYNVRDNTLLMQTASNFIWIRDGVVTETFKKATQTSITLYDTTQGIRIANNTKEWSYTYKTLGTTTASGGTAVSAVVPLTWQSAYHSAKGNELSVAINWIVTLYSPEGRIPAGVTLRCHSFDQDGYEAQRADYAIAPADWDALQFVRLRIQPKKGKALASSVQVDYAQHLVITDVTVLYGDEAQAPIASARSK